MTKKKRKVFLKTKDGKDTKCTFEMIETMKRVLSQGLSQNVAMAALEVSRDTFYRWKREIPEFYEAIKEVEPQQLASNEISIRKIATGEARGNVAAWQMIMRNQHGWDKNTGDGNQLTQHINIGQMNFLQDKSMPDLVEYIQDIQEEVMPLIEAEIVEDGTEE